MFKSRPGWIEERQSEAGAAEDKVDVFVQDETVWLTQKRMSELFSVDVRTISEHLRNIFNTNELKESATIRKIRTVQNEGSREVSREIEYYNLDAIIAVGYRMEDWVKFLHNFLELSNYPILKDKGSVSMLEAKLKAEKELEKYRVIQDRNYLSDFDKEIERIMGKNDDGK